MHISGLPSAFLTGQVQLGLGISDHSAEQLACDIPPTGVGDTEPAKNDTTSDEVGFADLLLQSPVALPPDSLALGWSQAGPVLLQVVEQSDPSAFAVKETSPQAESPDPLLLVTPIDLPTEGALPNGSDFAGVAHFLTIEAETLSNAPIEPQTSDGKGPRAESGQGAKETVTGRNILPAAEGDQAFRQGSDQSTNAFDEPRSKAFSRLNAFQPDPWAHSSGQGQAQENISPSPARSAIRPNEMSAHDLDITALQTLPIGSTAREHNLSQIGGNADRGSLAGTIKSALPAPELVFPAGTLENAPPRTEPSLSIASFDMGSGAASAAGDIKQIPLSGLLPNALFLHFALEAAPKEETSLPFPDVGSEAGSNEVHVPSFVAQPKTSDRSGLPAILSTLLLAERDDESTDQGLSVMPDVKSGSGQGSVHGGGSASASILAQITPQLVERITQGAMGTTTITLSPEELGPVRMSFQPDTQSPGQVVIMLTFDRAETMDLFRRHAEQLAEALRTVGYSGVHLGFGGPGGDGFRQGSQENPSAHSATREVATLDANFTGAAPMERIGLGGLDLRL